MKTTKSIRVQLGMALLCLLLVLMYGERLHAQNAAAKSEAELIAILQSNAPKAEQAMACKHLAIFGTAKAVPELAKLLNDQELASWARIALEAIPGKEADAALRDALSSLQGELLVGAVNSVAHRRDEAAVDGLGKLLENSNVDAMAAAAAALGRIGNAAAADLLERSLASTDAAVRSAAAEGCIYCAERSWAKGDLKQAVQLYDQVRKSQVPTPRIIEATRGAILARGADGTALLIEQLNSAEKQFFALGLQTLREIPASAGDKAFFAEIPKLSPEKGGLVLQALVERTGPVDLASILNLARSQQGTVQIAAVKALGKVGDATCVSQLISSAVNSNPELSATAKASLAELAGEGVDREIVGRLNNSDRDTLPILLELVGLRQIKAVDELVKALGDADAKVRSAALTSLGNTIPADRLEVLVNQVIKPRNPDDSPIALAALKTAAIRMPDRDKCANDLTLALNKNAGATAASLLEIIGAVGGTKALETVATAARSKDAQMQNVATRLLGEWMTIDAAPVLFDLSQQLTDAKFQTRAVKGYLRICRQFTMSEEERDSMCSQAWKICKQPAEKKLLLEILKRYPSPGTFRLAADARKVAEIKDDATATMLAIAQKLGGASDEVAKLLSDEGVRKVKLEIMRAEYGSGANQVDVTEVLKNCAKDQAWIVLPSPNYNQAFAKDPAPGTPKQLTIKYRINGKAGEVTLPENSLIFLPESSQ